jgi:hypothetical protein
VTAIVLTSNKDAADDMLTWNGLVGIVPMVDNATVSEFKCALHAGTFAMDWNKELNMEWSTKALQVAAEFDRRHKHLKIDKVRNTVKGYLDGLRPDRRKLASPVEIHRVLEAELDPPAQLSTQGDHLIATFNSVEEKGGISVCGNCLVMYRVFGV